MDKKNFAAFLVLKILLLTGIALGLSELYYDDGNLNGTNMLGLGAGFGVRFTPVSYPFNLTGLKYNLKQYSNRTFEVHVWAANGSEGTPGNDVIAPFNTTAPSLGANPYWHTVNLSQSYVINSGDFYAGFIHVFPFEPVMGCEDNAVINRSYNYDGSIWDLDSTKQYGIRALGHYLNLTSFTIELRQGWNLVSIPREISDDE